MQVYGRHLLILTLICKVAFLKFDGGSTTRFVVSFITYFYRS